MINHIIVHIIIITKHSVFNYMSFKVTKLVGCGYRNSVTRVDSWPFRIGTMEAPASIVPMEAGASIVPASIVYGGWHHILLLFVIFCLELIAQYRNSGVVLLFVRNVSPIKRKHP